ncbi:Retrovirus-related Pol polyprotein from transposon [Nosema granulosis]|uniref:Retrovirus-related Pol polyprotein from transposon n=1 Tax=Nosema granulosis TaxID=83296 RepID=A0A9P6GYK8_9MICR|nr:Retrovirus-related Pol polyprotein from transposon [Nosema granulosis]
MISAFSKNFDKHQMNYSVTDKELLAVVKGINHYRHYLLGRPFTLRTDHKALTYLWECKNPTSRLLRWSMRLQEYSFKIEYVKGEDNIADGCSRINNISLHKGEATLTDEEKRAIVQEYHRISDHGSTNNCKFMISRRYQWNGMYKEIEEYVKNCTTCQKTGPIKINTKNKVILTSSPNELWEIDLFRRIVDRGKNKFILVAIDHFTKWVETKVIHKKTADEICKAIEEIIIQKHGIPKKILTDNGLEFKKQINNTLTKKYGIKWIYASS